MGVIIKDFDFVSPFWFGMRLKVRMHALNIQSRAWIWLEAPQISKFKIVRYC